ncbi:helicase-related protein [Dactylosporangium sp. NPDC051485]|uniref:helicase-related protein n=1 Tax=Dactylosporangium sp. NPDC051485 TaxID=3154846 RepID=UPI00342F004D
MAFESEQRIYLPSGAPVTGWFTVDMAQQMSDGRWTLYLADDEGALRKIVLEADLAAKTEILAQDGRAPSERILAGMWTQWMRAASSNAANSLLASSPLKPYAHQTAAVYGAMLPQPFLRFVLADEAGTGKTIMAGLYLREMQRLGLIRRALVVAPANLVTKWQADFGRFFGGGLRRITAETVREHALDGGHDMWVVSLELAAVNPAVQDAVRPDKAGWDCVVFDEAHRMTPTASSFHQVGRLLARNTPRALLMTATPHRGSEWLFRHLLHLTDPAIYPDPGLKSDGDLTALRPGSTHFLRRMKEDLRDYDGVTALFKGRKAENFPIPLSGPEFGVYQQALDMVDDFFPPTAQPLARMVYGKRAASALASLAITLRRRSEKMGSQTEAEADLEASREDEADAEARDEAKVVAAGSRAARAEQSRITDLLGQIDRIVADPGYEPSKWRRLTEDCLAANGIHPGGRERAVIFTEYADTAEWLVGRLTKAGFSTRVYSGRIPHADRDEIRAAFMRGDFQIIVTTDAGNEGIDLQAAQTLINYDIPWSLVKLEQRMGRIHRVGQDRDVRMYNLIALDTREGQTMAVLLDNFVTAANELGGQIFDSLSVVAELTGVAYDQWLLDLIGNDPARRAAAEQAARKVQAVDLKRAAQQVRDDDRELATTVDAMAALTLLQNDLLERINPAIVESYLRRLGDAGLVRVQPTALGEGILQLSSDSPLPTALGGASSTLIATSGNALLAHAASVDTGNVIPLGPGEPAFAELITVADGALAPDLYRSGAAEDPTSVTGYELHAYHGVLSEAGGRKSTQWATLIRVDGTGQAYPVRWETLANLVPTGQRGGRPHIGRTDAADQAATKLAASTQAQQQQVRNEWFARARRDLEALPTTLTMRIADRQERLRLRAQLEGQVALRLSELETLSRVEVSPPTHVTWLRVHPGGVPATVEEKDSELVAMAHVTALLTSQDWAVADVASDNRGYDLFARRGREHRLVEVKGIWRSAASTGIRMTGNEVLIATQHRDDYWLYVVDQCQDGHGTLFGRYRNPALLFADDIVGDAIFRVPGSSLKAKRHMTERTA